MSNTQNAALVAAVLSVTFAIMLAQTPRTYYVLRIVIGVLLGFMIAMAVVL